MTVIGWRRTDSFSWGSLTPFSLPAGSWTAVASFKDSRRPVSAASDFGIVVTVLDLGVHAGDTTKHDYTLAMAAPEATVAAWPTARTPNDLVDLVGVIVFSDGVNRVSTDEFTLRERP